MITILPGDMTLLDAAELARSRGELLLIDGRRSVLSPTPISGFARVWVRNHPQEGKTCGK